MGHWQRCATPRTEYVYVCLSHSHGLGTISSGHPEFPGAIPLTSALQCI
jgi:hypothetical protein